MNNYEIMMNGNVKIGEAAPDFEAITTMGNIRLSDYKGKWVVLFSHPGDFTPVFPIFKLLKVLKKQGFLILENFVFLKYLRR